MKDLEQGSLLEIINRHQADFTQLCQDEISSILNLHLPECIILKDDLSPMQIYNEICLHAFAHKTAIKPLALKIINLEYKLRGYPPPELDAILHLAKKTYQPLARNMLKKFFRTKYHARISNEFYDYLPNIADHTGISFLSAFLPVSKLPKIRKPRIKNSKTQKDEFHFIDWASEFSRFEKGKLIPPKHGYAQRCAWCSKTIIWNESEIRQSKMYNFFACSKNCYDAMRIHYVRQSHIN